MKHDWNTLSNYLEVHEKILRGFWQHMVTQKMYGPPTWLTLDGQWRGIACRGIQLNTIAGNIIHVKIEKDFIVDDTYPKRIMAKTHGYSYQANRPDGTQLIRYCSPDPDYVKIGAYTGTAHHAYHHLHDFTSGKEIVTHIGDDDWPHVGEFLTEVRQRF